MAARHRRGVQVVPPSGPVASTTQSVDWPTCSSSNFIRWRPRAPTNAKRGLTIEARYKSPDGAQRNPELMGPGSPGSAPPELRAELHLVGGDVARLFNDLNLLDRGAAKFRCFEAKQGFSLLPAPIVGLVGSRPHAG